VLDFLGAGDVKGVPAGLEAQLRERFETVEASLPKETAEHIFDDLNSVAVARQTGNQALANDLVQAAMAKWQATLSRSYQQAVAEHAPWYKSQTNWFVIAGGIAALVLLVVLTKKKGT